MSQFKMEACKMTNNTQDVFVSCISLRKSYADRCTPLLRILMFQLILILSLIYITDTIRHETLMSCLY
jgi:hypothetical protein